jgi:hypothetical protein
METKILCMDLYGCPSPSQSSPPDYPVLGVFFPHPPFLLILNDRVSRTDSNGETTAEEEK